MGIMAGNDLYEDRILEHYEAPFHCGSCPGATHAHEDRNPLCGDEVRMEARVGPGDVVEDVYFSGDGCCVCLAAASILTEWSSGKPVSEVMSLRAEDMLALFGPRLTPVRQRCCLLGWQVLKAALCLGCPHNRQL
jgi:nitrogen fixation NifU-like protein